MSNPCITPNSDKFELVGPNEDMIELAKDIVKQHSEIIETNKRLMQILNTSMWYVKKEEKN